MKPRIRKSRDGMWDCGLNGNDPHTWRDVTPFKAWAGWALSRAFTYRGQDEAVTQR